MSDGTASEKRNETWTAVDGYISDLFGASDPVLEAALAAADAAGLPQIAVSAPQGKLLMLLAKAHGVQRILEIGTLAAYSTIWLARALPADGRLITLEFEARHAEVARENLKRAGLADKVEVRLGRAIDNLPKLLAEGAGPFDFIFIDADKPSYPDYLDWALRLSRPGTVIIADNVVRDGKIADKNSDDELVRGVQRFNEKLAAEKRVDAVALQTVGSKGYDGFALALVR
jgi:predicted O-methyltransferase YrrM